MNGYSSQSTQTIADIITTIVDTNNFRSFKIKYNNPLLLSLGNIHLVAFDG